MMYFPSITRWMPSISSRVADSFIDDAARTELNGLEEIRRLNGRGQQNDARPDVGERRRAPSTPPIRGIATSRSRMSGCESRAMRMASMPSAPFGHDLESRLAFEQPPQSVAENLVVVRDRDAHAARLIRHGHPSSNVSSRRAPTPGAESTASCAPAMRARSLMMAGPTRPFLQLARATAALELETLAVVLDDEAARVLVVGETHEHVARAAVLPDVDERLLDDPRQFERRRRRSEMGPPVAYESRRDTRIAAEAVDQRGEHVGKLIARFELDRPQRLHQFPQREDLALQQLLNVAQLRVHRRLVSARSGGAAPRSSSRFQIAPGWLRSCSSRATRAVRRRRRATAAAAGGTRSSRRA